MRSLSLSFSPLTDAHFSQMLSWLEEPHVKQWWDPHVEWSEEKIRHKYIHYLSDGCPEILDRQKIRAFIMYYEDQPIGYVQLYDATLFAQEKGVASLCPWPAGAFDLFIGESSYLGKGIGTSALIFFLEQYASTYLSIIADPHRDNWAARKSYAKAGFVIIQDDPLTDEIIMMKQLLPRVSF